MRCRDLLAAALLVIVTVPSASSRPQDPGAQDERARADRAYREQDWKTARASYAAIVEREPANGQALVRLGTAHHHLGEYAQAIEAYGRAIAIGQNTTAMFNLACSHALAGQPDRAFEWLEKALAAGFPQPGLIATDSDLASLKGDPRFAALAKRADELARPCMHDPRAREFDFWIGEWDVFDPAGNRAGSSRIERLVEGCAILEHWTALRGGGGKSLNLFHKEKDSWQQTWVDDRGGVIEFVEGRLADGAMRFTATTARPDGTKLWRKLSFFDLGPEKARQLSEQSADGRSWTVEYDFTYVRKKSPGAGSGAAK